MLDKPETVCYSIQARLPIIHRRSEPANLENDTEKKRAIKEEDSEDSKELSIERCLRIKRKSLILAQDERWRRA